jgi:alpha-L-fucosidase 2
MSIIEEDHGSGARTALQWMITQPGREGEIIMFPTWPKGWDIDFKLHAPLNTVVEGTCVGGKLFYWKVTPKERENDVIWGENPCSL